MTEDMQKIIIGAIVAIIMALIKRNTDLKLKALSQKVEETKEVTAKTHDLLNSTSVIQAGLYSVSAERLAAYSKNPEDIEEARQAKKTYEERKKVQKEAGV